MPSLRELQQGFTDAVLGAADVPPMFALAGTADGVERIAIYRRSIFTNYRNALAATYPVVKRLVGAPFFHTAIDEYVRAHPSMSGDLNIYGGAFGDFLATYPYAVDLPYLSDVARLEWSIDEANRAPDVAIAPERVIAALGAILPERLPAVRLRLHPSVHLIASAFPVLRIWQVNQADYVGDDLVALDAGGDTLIVARGSDGVTLTRLAAADHAWLATLASGGNLATAIDAAAATGADFDLGAALATHIGSGTIVAVIGDD